MELKKRQPTEREQAAITKLWEAWQELAKLGWKDPFYKCPSIDIEIIELGSAGIHIGTQEMFEGIGDAGRAWIFDANDAWPSRPLMIKEIK